MMTGKNMIEIAKMIGMTRPGLPAAAGASCGPGRSFDHHALRRLDRDLPLGLLHLDDERADDDCQRAKSKSGARLAWPPPVSRL